MNKTPENNRPAELWPTMLTPFTENGEVDYPALERLTEWYIENGSTGLFAVCQSSEMFFLSPEEREQIASFVCRQAGGRVPVIASGHVSESFDEQVRELTGMAQTGVEAVVLVANRLAEEGSPEDLFVERLDGLVSRLPKEIPLGFYECPYPYKKLLSGPMVRYCADSGRFHFLKDTSCDLSNIRGKLRAAAGSRFRLFNANASTLLESLRCGAAGYSGVMANIHPKLYGWLLKNWKSEPEKAEKVQELLTMCSLIESHGYPAVAKYILREDGLNIGTYCRSRKAEELTDTYRLEARQLISLSREIERRMGI